MLKCDKLPHFLHPFDLMICESLLSLRYLRLDLLLSAFFFLPLLWFLPSFSPFSLSLLFLSPQSLSLLPFGSSSSSYLRPRLPSFLGPLLWPEKVLECPASLPRLLLGVLSLLLLPALDPLDSHEDDLVVAPMVWGVSDLLRGFPVGFSKPCLVQKVLAIMSLSASL